MHEKDTESILQCQPFFAATFRLTSQCVLSIFVAIAQESGKVRKWESENTEERAMEDAVGARRYMDEDTEISSDFECGYG